MRSSVVAHIAFVLLLASLVVSGCLGVDFGNHWDEHRMTTSVRQVVESGRPLPAWYNYPSVVHHLVWLTLAPEFIGGGGDRARISERLFDPDATTPRFKKHVTLRLRTVFLLVTLLTCVWLYLAALQWRGSPWEALAAVAILGGSFEVAYHARWIAPDGVLMQFVALYLLFAIMGLQDRPDARRWLLLSAAVAGVACGTKYPGGILLLPVVWYVYRSARGIDKRGAAPVVAGTGSPFRGVLLAVLIFCAAFVVSTPGALIEPVKFWKDVSFELKHYETGHYGYTVSPGLDHGGRVIEYLALAALSHFRVTAAVLFALVVMGGGIVLRWHRRVALLLVATPVLYLVFLSLQRVMFVRNLLFVFPFMALAGARGGAAIVGAMRSRIASSLACAVFSGIVIANVAWLFYAASTVRHHSSISSERAIVEYMNRHPNDTFFVSQQIRPRIGLVDPRSFPVKTTVRRSEATRFLLDTCDGFDRKFWPANRLGRWEVVSGPFDVNWDYYPTWGGDCRVVAVDASTASKLGAIRGQVHD